MPPKLEKQAKGWILQGSADSVRGFNKFDDYLRQMLKDGKIYWPIQWKKAQQIFEGNDNKIGFIWRAQGKNKNENYCGLIATVTAETIAIDDFIKITASHGLAFEFLELLASNRLKKAETDLQDLEKEIKNLSKKEPDDVKAEIIKELEENLKKNKEKKSGKNKEKKLDELKKTNATVIKSNAEKKLKIDQKKLIEKREKISKDKYDGIKILKIRVMPEYSPQDISNLGATIPRKVINAEENSEKYGKHRIWGNNKNTNGGGRLAAITIARLKEGQLEILMQEMKLTCHPHANASPTMVDAEASLATTSSSSSHLSINNNSSSVIPSDLIDQRLLAHGAKKQPRTQMTRSEMSNIGQLGEQFWFKKLKKRYKDKSYSIEPTKSGFIAKATTSDHANESEVEVTWHNKDNKLKSAALDMHLALKDAQDNQTNYFHEVKATKEKKGRICPVHLTRRELQAFIWCTNISLIRVYNVYSHSCLREIFSDEIKKMLSNMENIKSISYTHRWELVNPYVAIDELNEIRKAFPTLFRRIENRPLPPSTSSSTSPSIGLDEFYGSDEHIAQIFREPEMVIYLYTQDPQLFFENITQDVRETIKQHYFDFLFMEQGHAWAQSNTHKRKEIEHIEDGPIQKSHKTGKEEVTPELPTNPLPPILGKRKESEEGDINTSATKKPNCSSNKSLSGTINLFEKLPKISEEELKQPGREFNDTHKEMSNEEKLRIGLKGETLVFATLFNHYKRKYKATPKRTSQGFDVTGVDIHCKCHGGYCEKKIDVTWHGISIKDTYKGQVGSPINMPLSHYLRELKTENTDAPIDIITTVTCKGHSENRIKLREVKATSASFVSRVTFSKLQLMAMQQYGRFFYLYRVFDVDNEEQGPMIEKCRNPLELLKPDEISGASIYLS